MKIRTGRQRYSRPQIQSRRVQFLASTFGSGAFPTSVEGPREKEMQKRRH